MRTDTLPRAHIHRHGCTRMFGQPPLASDVRRTQKLSWRLSWRSRRVDRRNAQANGVQSVDTVTGWAGGLHFGSKECSEASPHSAKPADDRMAKTGESFTAKASRHSQLYKDGKIPVASNFAHPCRPGLYRLRWRTGISLQEPQGQVCIKKTQTVTVRAAGQEIHSGRRMGWIEWTGRTQWGIR